jgi:hypothetical protein
LKNHRHVAMLWRQIIDALSINKNLAIRRLFQPGDHAERGCFSASGRPKKNNELTIADLQREIVDDRNVTEGLC